MSLDFACVAPCQHITIASFWCLIMCNASYLFQQKNLGETKKLLREAPLEENQKRELSSALHLLFKDWLYGNNCLNSCYFLINIVIC